MVVDITSDDGAINPDPADLLSSNNFINKAWSVLDSSNLCCPAMKEKPVCDKTKKLSHELAKLMIIRLHKLIQRKVDEDKKRHWMWKFAKDNIPVVSSLICIQHHVESESAVSECMQNENMCPIQKPEKQIC